MAFVNNVMIIRRDLLTRMAELFKEDRLKEQIDRIPLEISRQQSGYERCCVHKSRAVVKYKIMAILGFGTEDEKDELDNLAYYAEQVLEQGYRTGRYLTVADEACTSCVRANYTVTNLCKGCIAQPCMNNCPRKAITRISGGKAYIDPEKCINCGICMKLCPYHSIVYMPVPCEESCPVGAISKNTEGKERIDGDKCILCGKCINSCPFGSILERTDLFDIMKLLKGGHKVNALIAPSVFGQFSVKPAAVFDALRKLGFNRIIEVAEGAAMTTDAESAELQERLEDGRPFMATSCCPTWKQAANKHVPGMEGYLSSTPSPMAFAARLSREQEPETPVVFIGPCLAKRQEASDNSDIDWVMTFEEMGCLLNGWNISIVECGQDGNSGNAGPDSRNYCLSGGVAAAVKKAAKMEISTRIINGFDRKQLRALSVMATRAASEAQLIEVMACEGGCIAGPCSHEFPADARKFYCRNLEMAGDGHFPT